MISLDLLQQLCPNTKISILDGFVEPLNMVTEYYDISVSPQRTAGFIAQIAHESGGFRYTVENLNYSAQALRRVFNKYFPDDEIANIYARQPIKIASRVYANRMGNGPEESGDGWTFRGRGLIQLTGFNNYSRLAEALEMEIFQVIEYLETPEGAVASAGWYWHENDLNSYCDRNDFIGLTKRINGGTNGLEERQHYYNIALQFM